MKPTITFLPEKKAVTIGTAGSVLDVALGGDVAIGHSCGGMGSCGTCRVMVVKSEQPLPPRSELETVMAEDRGFQEQERLACQLPPQAGMVIAIPDEA
jgi:2Fe-2S ferredoxin